MTLTETAVITLKLGMTAAYALKGDRTVLIDAGNPGDEGKILDGLARAGVAPADVSLILITHGHVDHFGAAAALKAATGAPVAVHTADAGALRSGFNPPVTPRGRAGRWLKILLGRFVPGGGPPVEPDILLDGETALDEYGASARVIPTPGHTPGSISVHLPGGPVVIADLIFGGLLCRRRPHPPWVADDPDQNRDSVRAVLDLGPTALLAAHGGPFDPAAVRKWLGDPAV
jgi:glyoxylase-like metal-dependent hydrolase (beta-lactamase superfamily II)